VKCNPDPYVLRLLAALGTGFDCASNGEISQVLSLGVAPSRVIFANPCKPASFVRQAGRAGVDLMTFDNTDELHKVARSHPRARLVVRILTDDSKALCRLGLKYGAPLATVPALLATARELGLDVVGVSFHVGSGCYDTAAYMDAVARARAAFDMGKAAGYDFSLLDVGGGFEDATFECAAATLSDAIERYFPVRDGLSIIAEPGRYYVAKAFSLAVNVIARRAPPGVDVAGQDEEESEESAEGEPEQPRVMCQCWFYVWLCFSIADRGNGYLDRLHQRWCLRRLQLYHVRSPDSAAVRAMPERLAARPCVCAHVREQRVGADVRFDRCGVPGDAAAAVAGGGGLAGVREHGGVHDLRGVAVQRLRREPGRLHERGGRGERGGAGAAVARPRRGVRGGDGGLVASRRRTAWTWLWI
jgi:hypothetical protein